MQFQGYSTYRVIVREYSVKKVFLQILQNLQKNNRIEHFLKKSCSKKFCKIYKKKPVPGSLFY